MSKRLNEFCTSKRIRCNDLYLYAWATYKRGDIPDAGEFEYINDMIMDNFPNAEFVGMERLLEPFDDVRWDFTWVVYDYNKESKVK